MQEPIQPFDWERMLIDQFPWTYLAEVAFRTVLMFTIVLGALAVSGKREVRQLSIYELVLLIGLGSAAGDPMFYHDVPLVVVLVVFVVMMSTYKLITYISDRNKTIRESLEGKPVYVIEEGRILTRNLDREDVGVDELFSDLRVEGVEHLGQVKIAILEPSGQLSIFRFEQDDERPGLPILPKELAQTVDQITEPGAYACHTCGRVETVDKAAPELTCTDCQCTKWVRARK